MAEAGYLMMDRDVGVDEIMSAVLAAGLVVIAGEGDDWLGPVLAARLDAWQRRL